jgi:hypothetical protein
MAAGGRIVGGVALWLGVVLSVAALACAIVVALTDEDCDEALLVKARIDAGQTPVAGPRSAQSAETNSDAATILAKCAAAGASFMSLPALAGLLVALALGSFALALWIAKPWDRGGRVTYSGYRSRR